MVGLPAQILLLIVNVPPRGTESAQKYPITFHPLLSKMGSAKTMNITPENETKRSLYRELLVQFRLPILLVLHVVLFSVVFWLAMMMRFTMEIPEKYQTLFWKSLPFVVATKVVVFYLLRSFHGWWRHVHFSDVVSLARSAVVASLTVIALDYFFLGGSIPRMVVMNDLVIGIVTLGGLRSTWRVWDERIVPLRSSVKADRALLIGNDFDAARLAHMINGQHSLGVRIVGLVAPQGLTNGRKYFGDIRIVGVMKDLSELMEALRAETLFVVSGALPAKKMRELLDVATDSHFEIKILPKLEEQLKGVDKVPIREVSYDDLLRRKPADLDLNAIGEIIAHRSVMVTGAGGSIGSELCRQLVKFQPRELILLGRGENRIYEIERELKGLGLKVDLVPKIVNITDKARLAEVFRNHYPSIVFHAAAHKHVPLVEQNVGESIINNVLGTKNIADLADQYGVGRFVMVSTDKAVNPTSVMGCTKHMAERYCQTLDATSKTSFISTRFGNVLGSAGSVVPLFQKQIQAGGPITITDRRMTRYFMTIPEASQLVVQAATMGLGGEIFVLEMGEPVKIMDLANDLIRLAGHPPGSIDIVESGIRPGEKLFEELYYKNEKSIPTSHEKILSSKSRTYAMEEVNAQVSQLVDAAFETDENVKSLLKQFIKEFHYESTQQKTTPNGPHFLKMPNAITGDRLTQTP